MSFNKAPIKRFNEGQGNGPAPGTYNPNFDQCGKSGKCIAFDAYSARDLAETKPVHDGEFVVPSLTPGRSRKLYRNTSRSSSKNSRSRSTSTDPSHRSRSGSTSCRSTPKTKVMSNEEIISTLSQQKVDLSTHLAQREAEINDLQLAHNALDFEFQNTKKELFEKLNELEFCRQDKTERETWFQGKIDDFQTLLVKRATEIVELQLAETRLQSELNDSRSQLSTKLHELELEREDKAQIQATLKSDGEIFSTFSQRESDLLTNLTQRETEIKDLQSAHRALDLELEKMKKELSEKLNELELVRQDKAELGAVFQTKEEVFASVLSKKEEDFNTILGQREAEIKDLQLANKAWDCEFQSFKKDLSEKLNELELCKLDKAELEALLQRKEEDFITRLGQREAEITDLQLANTALDCEFQNTKKDLSEKLNELELCNRNKTELEALLQRKEEDFTIRLGQRETEITDLQLANTALDCEFQNTKKDLSDKLNELELCKREKTDLEALFLRKEDDFTTRLGQRETEIKDLQLAHTALDCEFQNTKQNLSENLEFYKRDKADLEALLQRKEDDFTTRLGQREAEITDLQSAHSVLDCEFQNTKKDLSEKLEFCRREKTELEVLFQGKENEFTTLTVQRETEIKDLHSALTALDYEFQNTRKDLSDKLELCKREKADLEVLFQGKEDDFTTRLGQREAEITALQSVHCALDYEFQNTRKELTEKLESCRRDKDELEAVLKGKEDDFITSLNQKEAEIAALQSAHSALDCEFQNTKKDISDKLELCRRDKDELEALFQGKEDDFKTIICQREAEITDLQSAHSALNCEFQNTKIDLTEKLESCRRDKAELEVLFQIKEDDFTTRLVQREVEIADLQSAHSALDYELENTKKQLSEKLSELEFSRRDKAELEILFQGKEDDFITRLNQREAEITALQSAHSALNDEFRNTKIDLSDKLESLRRDKADLEAFWQGKEDDFKTIICQREAEITDLQSAHSALDCEFQNTKIDLTEKLESCRGDKVELEVLFQAKEDDFTTRLVQREAEITDLQSAHRALDYELQNTKKELSEKLNELEFSRQDKSELEALFQGKEEVFALVLSKKEDDFKSILGQREAEINDLQLEHNALDCKFQNTKRDLSEKLNELELCKQDKAELEAILQRKEDDSTLRLGQKEAEIAKLKTELLNKISCSQREAQLLVDVNNLKIENRLMTEQKDAVEAKLKVVSDDYAILMGHGNHRQKIMHVLKLKEEKDYFKKDSEELRVKLAKKDAEIVELKKTLKTSGAGGLRKFDKSEAFKCALKEPYIPASGDLRGSDSRQTFVIPKKTAPPPVTTRIRQETRRETGQGMAFEIEFDDNKENGN